MVDVKKELKPFLILQSHLDLLLCICNQVINFLLVAITAIICRFYCCYNFKNDFKCFFQIVVNETRWIVNVYYPESTPNIHDLFPCSIFHFLPFSRLHFWYTRWVPARFVIGVAGVILPDKVLWFVQEERGYLITQLSFLAKQVLVSFQKLINFCLSFFRDIQERIIQYDQFCM